jgi:hypothetical protein
MARSSLGRWRTHGEDAVLVVGVAEVGDNLDGARTRAAMETNNGSRERESGSGVCGGLALGLQGGTRKGFIGGCILRTITTSHVMLRNASLSNGAY